jgi:hypothetical protein
MSNTAVDEVVFFTLVGTVRERAGAHLLLDSLRSFGGDLSRCPIWVFETNPEGAPCRGLARSGVEILPLQVPETTRHYYFAGKVAACARAEELAAGSVRSQTRERVPSQIREGTPSQTSVPTLAWMAPDCLVIQPPLLFHLARQISPDGTAFDATAFHAAAFDAAVRPVHIRNVGLPATGPLDSFWQGIYEAMGVPDVETTVESFVDRQQLRAYYNSHAFAVNPALGILRRWSELFEALVCDREFQERACQDGRHQVFLHQAVLSALLATSLEPARVRLLPPEYNYPYNLHSSVPAQWRARALNDLVCIACEDRSLDPAVVDDIAVHEPMRSWLAARQDAV